MDRLNRDALEHRIFEHLWLPVENVRLLLPEKNSDEGLLEAHQATTATANFAIAVYIISAELPEERARAVLQTVERLMFERIALNGKLFIVSDVLRLPEDQNLWLSETAGADIHSRAKLDLIMRAVHWARLPVYQSEMVRGMEYTDQEGIRPEVSSVLGFFAKLWVSQVTGRPIRERENMFEEGLGDMMVTAYFSIVLKELIETVEETNR